MKLSVFGRLTQCRLFWTYGSVFVGDYQYFFVRWVENLSAGIGSDLPPYTLSDHLWGCLWMARILTIPLIWVVVGRAIFVGLYSLNMNFSMGKRAPMSTGLFKWIVLACPFVSESQNLQQIFRKQNLSQWLTGIVLVHHLVTLLW